MPYESRVRMFTSISRDTYKPISLREMENTPFLPTGSFVARASRKHYIKTLCFIGMGKTGKIIFSYLENEAHL